MFSVFDMVYNTILFATLLYMYQRRSCLNMAEKKLHLLIRLLHGTFLTLAAISAVFMILAIIGIRRKDRPEFYGTGEVQKITF